MSFAKAKLGDLINLKRGFDLPHNSRKDGDIPVISSSGRSGYHNMAKVNGPAVVTGRYGTLGEVFYINEPCWPLNTSLYVENFKGNNPRFVFYFLKNFLKKVQSDKAAVPGFNRNDLHARDVLIQKELIKQEKIAAILSAYDDLIENNRRRIELLEESARLLYQEWFVRLRFPGHETTRIINGIPLGWQRKCIENVAETIGGGTPSTKRTQFWDDGKIFWFVPGDLTNNNCLALLNSSRKISEHGLKNSSAKMLPPETILMTSRASIGFFGLFESDCCTNQGFINLIPKIPNFKMYLLHNLKSRVALINHLASGATFKEINKTTFKGISIIVPPDELLKKFEVLSYNFFQHTRLLLKQNQKLAEARDLLLPRLMSGEIEV